MGKFSTNSIVDCAWLPQASTPVVDVTKHDYCAEGSARGPAVPVTTNVGDAAKCQAHIRRAAAATADTSEGMYTSPTFKCPTTTVCNVTTTRRAVDGITLQGKLLVELLYEC